MEEGVGGPNFRGKGKIALQQREKKMRQTTEGRGGGANYREKRKGAKHRGKGT